jgi:hypothetical protein
MHYKFRLEKINGSWVYVIAFGKDTPTEPERAAEYSDHCHSAVDLHGIRHFVFLKAGKIVQIQLHDALRILPHLDPEHSETIRGPEMRAIKTGEPPQPTLLIEFKPYPLKSRTAYGLSPNVYLVFHDGELAELYIHDVYAMIADVD